jgi:hypothetical protein
MFEIFGSIFHDDPGAMFTIKRKKTIELTYLSRLKGTLEAKCYLVRLLEELLQKGIITGDFKFSIDPEAFTIDNGNISEEFDTEYGFAYYYNHTIPIDNILKQLRESCNTKGKLSNRTGNNRTRRPGNQGNKSNRKSGKQGKTSGNNSSQGNNEPGSQGNNVSGNQGIKSNRKSGKQGKTSGNNSRQGINEPGRQGINEPGRQGNNSTQGNKSGITGSMNPLISSAA